MAFCSSSPLSAKLMEETKSTLRTLPSFKTTTSSLISAMDKYFWVDCTGLARASLLWLSLIYNSYEFTNFYEYTNGKIIRIFIMISN